MTEVGPLNIKSTRMVEEGLSVQVALQGGRLVSVMALKKTDPHVGDHVEITEHRHRTGPHHVHLEVARSRPPSFSSSPAISTFSPSASRTYRRRTATSTTIASG